MRHIIFLLFLYLPLLSFSQIDKVIFDSEVNFEIKNAGLLVKGNFGELKGFIRFDPNNFKGSKIRVFVKATSISTAIEARDKHLKKKEYFDIESFPEIVLESKFFGSSEKGYKGYFLLTMKGVSKDIVIPFTYIDKGDFVEMNGEFNLNRLDFGIGEKSFIMADNVKVIIKLKLKEK
jgi:polyisoprenoid-binding protein YceI